jgi:predicted nucleic acid-binding protein
MTAFADTFALIAWLNRVDPAHARVAGYLDAYTGRLVTTDWVLVELADAFAAPPARAAAIAFLRAVREDPLFEVVGYSDEVYQAGFELYTARPDKAWSLTDCISFAVMTARGLTDALSADRHFEQAGFRAVFKDPGST